MNDTIQPAAAYRPDFTPLRAPWLPPALLGLPLLELPGLAPIPLPDLAPLLAPSAMPWHEPPAADPAIPREEADRGGGGRPPRDPPGHEGRVIVVHGAEIDVEHPELSGDLLTWRIAGGEDAARFLMDPGTGALRFLVAPDPARPADADQDGFYELLIEAKDVWGEIALQPLRVHVVPGEGRQSPAPSFDADLASGMEGCLGPFMPAPLDTSAWSARDWVMI
jgi:hypothetical protein